MVGAVAGKLGFLPFHSSNTLMYSPIFRPIDFASGRPMDYGFR